MRAGLLVVTLTATLLVAQQEEHHHPAPDKLGTVSFPVSCRAEVQQPFNRAVALLHSFAYREADAAFHAVAAQDPVCAMAHWGSAMTHYHQLWDLPPSPADTAAARAEIAQALAIPQTPERDLRWIEALRVISAEGEQSYRVRAAAYSSAMQRIAGAAPQDVEAQVFYALALISTASPVDREHRQQKMAAALLEPLFHAHPDHPGIPHYLIHACDNAELAQQGLPAARAYARIAPSAPHALHMPSHIFTRLGLWQDSIASNQAARHAARQQSDMGEELHAMDYLVYAYLQRGEDEQAAAVLSDLAAMGGLRFSDFKVGYAATAMPVRYLVERQRWAEAARVGDAAAGAAPQVRAVTVWARGLGKARTGDGQGAAAEAATLARLAEELRPAGNPYWATQVESQRREVLAWAAQAAHEQTTAVSLLRAAADAEDGVEKLPATPGPIVPAREQLGWLLLQQGDHAGAAREFGVALRNAPGRRGTLAGLAEAEKKVGTSAKLDIRSFGY